MAALADTFPQKRRFYFVSPAFPPETFAVVSFEGYEAISTQYRFAINLVSEDAEIDTLLNKSATFTIRGLEEDEKEVIYHGIITEFEQSHRLQDLTFYRIVLKPRFSRMGITKISEVYLNEQTIPDIITRVLQDGGLTSLDFKMNLIRGDYRKKSFVCQYEETYFHFISRLMERDGICYYFRQDENQEILTLTDTVTTHPQSGAPFFYREKAMMDDAFFESAIPTLVMKQKVIPARVVLKEYNFRRSTQDLTVSADVSDSGVGEVIIYGENYRTTEEGKVLAKLRAEEIFCREKVFAGESSAIGLVSGYFITLKDHYRESFNQDYMVVEVKHEGAQAWAFLAGLGMGDIREKEDYYRNSFSLIPSSRQFRPERLTLKPKIHGAMSAFIDAEGSGEYAEINEYGQYKVQLPYDKTDKPDAKASAWIRMMTPYAGSNHGMHFPLLKETEVILTFIDGDPDLPVISGAVPNSINPSVVKDSNLSTNVIKTAGGNHLALGDDKGGQFISLWSPQNQSGIAIGATQKGGGGSLEFKTKGNQNSWVLGQHNSFTVGGKFFATAGAQAIVNAGTMSTINGGLFSTCNIAGASITYNTSASKSYTLGPGKAYNIRDNATFGTLKELKLAGGVHSITRKGMDTGFAAITAAIAASLAGVVGSAFIGELYSADGTGPIEGGEAWKSGVGASVLASSLIGAGLAWWKLISSMGNGYDGALKTGQVAGVIKLNDDGVDISSYLNNAIVLKTYPMPLYSEFNMDNSKTVIGTYGGGQESIISLEMNKASFACKQGPDKTEIEFKPTEIKINSDPAGGQIKVSKNSVQCLSPAQASKLTITKNEISSKAGSASISLSTPGIKFKSSQIQAAADAVLKLEGGAIKIG